MIHRIWCAIVHKQRLSATLLSFTAALAPLTPGAGCAIFPSDALMINDRHPDLPLSLFARGNLGVIRGDWARSYLLVSYRYLNNQSLDDVEQKSILSLWHRRLENMSTMTYRADNANFDPRVSYFRLRSKITGAKIPADAQRYDFKVANCVLDDAFTFATQNLQLVIKSFGDKSIETKDWLKAQDAVFGANDSRKVVVPDELKSEAPTLLKLQRQYQIAAAKFYLNDLPAAQQLFESIARSGDPYWKDLCEYMSCRALVNNAFEHPEGQSFSAIFQRVEKVLEQNPHSKFKNDLIDLCNHVRYQEVLSLSDSLKQLAQAVLQMHSTRFGEDVSDFTTLMDSQDSTFKEDDYPFSLFNTSTSELSKKTLPGIESYDVADWLDTIHTPYTAYMDDEQSKRLKQRELSLAKHALQRWRQTHSLAWLVAAISRNDLLLPANNDLFAALEKVPSSSPAFLTARFYFIDYLIKNKRAGDARKALAQCLAVKNLPPSARYLFLCQQQLMSKTMRELLQSSAREALGEQTEIDTIGLPENWMKAEQSSHYYDTGMQLGDLLASDINSNLPQLYWESWAKDPAVASSFRKELVRATWFRAKLLGKDNVLNDEMQKCFPAIAADISTYKNVANSDEKRFVLSCLILKNRRMSPFAKPVPPTLDEFNYYRQNFWLPAPVSEKERLAQRASAPATGTPYPENASEIWKCPAIFTGTDRVATLLESYDKPVVRNLLNSNELRQLNEERSALAKQDPAEFVCAPVIRWAKTHQSDPRVPEMLYRCVKFPLWRAGAKTGTKYSKDSLIVLHKQYPHSSWARKVDYSYSAE